MEISTELGTTLRQDTATVLDDSATQLATTSRGKTTTINEATTARALDGSTATKEATGIVFSISPLYESSITEEPLTTIKLGTHSSIRNQSSTSTSEQTTAETASTTGDKQATTHIVTSVQPTTFQTTLFETAAIIAESTTASSTISIKTSVPIGSTVIETTTTVKPLRSSSPFSTEDETDSITTTESSTEATPTVRLKTTTQSEVETTTTADVELTTTEMKSTVLLVETTAVESTTFWTTTKPQSTTTSSRETTSGAPTTDALGTSKMDSTSGETTVNKVVTTQPTTSEALSSITTMTPTANEETTTTITTPTPTMTTALTSTIITATTSNEKTETAKPDSTTKVETTIADLGHTTAIPETTTTVKLLATGITTQQDTPSSTKKPETVKITTKTETTMLKKSPDTTVITTKSETTVIKTIQETVTTMPEMYTTTKLSITGRHTTTKSVDSTEVRTTTPTPSALTSSTTVTTSGAMTSTKVTTTMRPITQKVRPTTINAMTTYLRELVKTVPLSKSAIESQRATISKQTAEKTTEVKQMEITTVKSVTMFDKTGRVSSTDEEQSSKRSEESFSALFFTTSRSEKQTSIGMQRVSTVITTSELEATVNDTLSSVQKTRSTAETESFPMAQPTVTSSSELSRSETIKMEPRKQSPSAAATKRIYVTTSKQKTTGLKECGTICGTLYNQTIYGTSSVPGCTNVQKTVVPCPVVKCPTDCEWTNWGTWGLCSLTCGDGVVSRYRQVNYAAKVGGLPCLENNMETTSCSGNCTEPYVEPETEAVWLKSGIDDDTLEDPSALSATMQDTLPFILEPLSDELRNILGHQLKETIPLCTYNGLNCNFEKDFKQIYDPAMGNCFVYNHKFPSVRSTYRAGAPFGLIMMVQGSQSDYVCSSQTAGFKILIHNATEHPFPDSAGYLVGPGTVNDIAIRQQMIDRLSEPYGDCIPSDELSAYYYNGTFTVEGCLRSCFQDQMAANCSCGDPRFPMPKNTHLKACTLTQKSCLDTLRICSTELMEDANCICENPCTEYVFRSTLTQAILKNQKMLENICRGSHNASKEIYDCYSNSKKNYALVRIYYDKLNSQNYVETPAYTIIQLASDFGGILGVVLGPSAITFVEFGYCIIGLIIFAASKEETSIM